MFIFGFTQIESELIIDSQIIVTRSLDRVPVVMVDYITPFAFLSDDSFGSAMASSTFLQTLSVIFQRNCNVVLGYFLMSGV